MSRDALIARRATTRERVAQLLASGLTRQEVAVRLGLTKSTIAYHARGLGRRPDERFSRRYDWTVIQAYYDLGHSLGACEARFGFSRASWSQAINRGDIVPRPSGMSIEDLLAGRRNRQHLKRRLIAAGLKSPRCDVCGIDSWRDRPLSLALHHVNGAKHDNRLENVQLLCPNRHSQTENFGGRNKPRGPREDVGAAGPGGSPTPGRP